jgi:hypothetical protein
MLGKMSADFQIVAGTTTTKGAATLVGSVVSALTGNAVGGALGRAADSITDAMGIDVKIDLNDMRIQVVDKPTLTQK